MNKYLIQQRLQFLKDNNHEGYDFHNTLVNARSKGFKSGNDFQDLLNYWEWQDNKKKKEKQFQIDKENLLREYGYKLKDWNRLYISSGHNGFNENKETPIKNMRNFLDSLKEKELSQSKLNNKKINLLKKFDKYNFNLSEEKNIENFKYFIIAAHKHNFNSKDDLKNIEDYFNWLANNYYINKNDPHICKHENIKETINEEHKKLCEKYDIYYKNERTWGNYITQSKKLHISIEDYLKLIQKENNKISEIKDIKNLLIKYEIFNIDYKIHPRTITTYKKRAEKENLSVEEYLKQIYQKKKDRENIMIEFGFKPDEFPRKLAAARNAGYRTDNEIEDVRNLLELQNKAKKEKEDLQRKRDEFMIQNGLDPKNWTNNLVTARAHGFKSNNPFKDLSNYFEYKSEIKELLKIKKKRSYNPDKYTLNESELKLLEDNINGFNKIKEINDNIDKNFIFKENEMIHLYGYIYCWFIKDIPFYLGETINIMSRTYFHMYEIWTEPEYWCNIKNYIQNNKNDVNIYNNKIIEVKILKKIDNINLLNDIQFKEILHNYEREFIKELKPVSQKCKNGSDDIIKLEDRKFNFKDIIDYYNSII